MSLETWAVAALAIVDVEGTPLLLRTYTSSRDVLNSPAAPLHAHLYVGPEDIIKLHFVLFASLDRCEERRELAAGLGSSPVALGTVTADGSIALSRSGGGAGGSMSVVGSGGGGAAAGPSAPSGTVTANDSLNTSMVNAASATAGAGSAARLISSTTDARFLGKLLESHRMRSYGFRSATGIYTLLVTVGGEAPADAMVPLSRALYECASAALCNPFRSPAQSWRAQEQLLWRASAAAGAPSPCVDEHAAAAGAEGFGIPLDEDDDNSAASHHHHHHQHHAQRPYSVAAAGASRPSLLPGSAEWSWPRPAPTSVAALTAEPTLALSRTFNTQIEGLLSSFTVTVRSCIIR